MFKNPLAGPSGKKVLILTGAAILISVLWGITDQPFFRRFTDGITLSACILLLAGGMISRSFGSGYSFMLARKQTGKKVSQLMEERFEEEAKRENPALSAGLILLIIMILCMIPYLIQS